MKARRACLLTLLLSLAAPMAARAEAPSPTAERQAKLLLRVLSYDRALASWSRGRLKIGVLSDRSGDSKASDCEDVLRALQAAKSYTVKKLPVEVVALEYKDAGELERAIAAASINILYVCPSMAPRLPTVVALAER